MAYHPDIYGTNEGGAEVVGPSCIFVSVVQKRERKKKMLF